MAKQYLAKAFQPVSNITQITEKGQVESTNDNLL